MKYQQTLYSLMSQQQLAEYWGISTRTLEHWRSIGWGPKFIKIGGRVLDDNYPDRSATIILSR